MGGKQKMLSFNNDEKSIPLAPVPTENTRSKNSDENNFKR